MKASGSDGRTQRSEVGRQRVSEALVALVSDQGRMPTVEEVAARAGVSRRSVFRYFDGVEALELETARAMRAMVTDRLPLPAAEGPLEKRLWVLVQHRARLYEQISPVRRFLEAARNRGNLTFGEFIQDGQRRLREHLQAVLAPELKERPEMLPVLDLLTSWEAWVALRDGQRCSVPAAEAILLGALRAQLAATPAGRPPSDEERGQPVEGVDQE
jgi:AcrR family transcriptional regulator